MTEIINKKDGKKKQKKAEKRKQRETDRNKRNAYSEGAPPQRGRLANCAEESNPASQNKEYKTNNKTTLKNKIKTTGRRPRRLSH